MDDLQHWLADDQTEQRVTIPFARDLAVWCRRWRYGCAVTSAPILALIRHHAVLHQLNRSRDAEGRIVATVEEDYAVVRELVSSAVSQGVGTTVSGTVREAVEAVIDLAPTLVASGVSTNAVAEHLKVHKSTASRRLSSHSTAPTSRTCSPNPACLTAGSKARRCLPRRTCCRRLRNCCVSGCARIPC